MLEAKAVVADTLIEVTIEDADGGRNEGYMQGQNSRGHD